MNYLVGPFLVCLTIALNSARVYAGVGEQHRPEALQKEVDLAFKRLNQKSINWGLFDGTGFYNLMNLEEKHLIKNLANRDDSRTDIYLVDVGAAKGGWGRDVESFIKEELSNCEKHFHIFSLTGGNELKEEIVEDENVTHYRLSQFKIENIGSELLKRGYNLSGKVDLMVSNWTLRHLVDPFGTLEDMYGLLNPHHGILLSTGFRFMMMDSIGSPIYNDFRSRVMSTNQCWATLSLTSTTCVFRHSIDSAGIGQFMLIRTNDHLLNLQLDYIGNFTVPSWRYDVASEKVSEYQLKTSLENHKELAWGVDHRYQNEYCSDLSSKETFDQLKLEYCYSFWEPEELSKAKRKALQTYKALYLGGYETAESKMIKDSLLGVSGDATIEKREQAKRNLK